MTTPLTYAYELWKHLHDEHKLTLLENELQTIIELAKRTQHTMTNLEKCFQEIAQISETPNAEPYRSALHKDVLRCILAAFYDEVDRRAQERMQRTGILAGSHQEAMKEVIKEWTE